MTHYLVLGFTSPPACLPVRPPACPPARLQVSVSSGSKAGSQGMPVVDAAGRCVGIVFRQIAIAASRAAAGRRRRSAGGRRRGRRAAEFAMLAAPTSVVEHFLRDLVAQGRCVMLTIMIMVTASAAYV